MKSEAEYFISIRKHINNVIEEMYCLKMGGLKIVEHITNLTDTFIINLYRSVEKDFSSEGASLPNIAIVAVGGYGRKELTPYSDIDIMIISERRDSISEKIAKAFLYRLWDTSLNIAHSFRTLEECLEDSMRDITIRTSLMDSRFLVGDIKLFEKYKSDIYQKILLRNRKEFIFEIIREVARRHKKSDQSIYLLEPDIKEGKGGLRDVHAVKWLTETSLRIKNLQDLINIMPKNEYRHFIKAYDFLLKIRVSLHSLSKRRNDILSFEFHTPVAEMMGIRSTKKYKSAEILMRLYYKKAGYIQNVFDKVLHLIFSKFNRFTDFSVKKLSDNFLLSKNEIVAINQRTLKNIDNIFEAFFLYSLLGKRFSNQLESAIQNRALYIKRSHIYSKTAHYYFKEILKGNRTYETLLLMHKLSILDRFIPEFGRLRYLVIYEPYHKYTVDEHTLLAIKNLQEIKNSKNENLQNLRNIIRKLKQEILFFALLLHDIGKGFTTAQDRGHGEKGYKIIKTLLERFDMPAEDRNKIEFLVKNHTILSKLALTRDTSAPETVTTLCEIVQNEENLDYLFLMSYADMTAVSPAFWTDWKAYLFSELINKAKCHLKGTIEEKEITFDEEISKFLKDMPGNYVIAHTYEEITADYEVIKKLREKDLVILIEEHQDGTALLTISTADVLGLFSKIVKVLSSKGLNIIRARLYTSRSGYVLDKILLSNWKDLWWGGLEDELKRGLKESIFQKEEELPIGYSALLDSKGKNNLLEIKKRTPPTKYEYFIEIDNETSTKFTLIEIAVPDRIGLLYDVSTIIYLNKIDITSAIINTEQGIADDVFYVQKEGRKLDPFIVERLLGELHALMSIYRV